MGWTIYERDGRIDPGEECRRLCTWENADGARRVLADAFVGTTWYAAVEHIKPDGARVVWAAVFLTQRHPFGYKDMDETMGPYECGCPAHILDLLTPTDSEHALGWRWACRERLSPGKNGPRPKTRQEVWNEAHASDLVTAAAWGDWAAWVPEGKTGVVARRASDGFEQWALVDAALYARRHEGAPPGVMGALILDPERDCFIDPPADQNATKEVRLG